MRKGEGRFPVGMTGPGSFRAARFFVVENPIRVLRAPVQEGKLT
ncbi:hypothetical protein Daudx_1532 [Candidatus Desulforudis audaxviator]|nr:hypothetical protein Daudx_1532 [Candidatus Desulforudis audaxviator]